MNKKMRELRTKIQEKTTQAKYFMAEETKDLDKATALMDEVDQLEKEYALEERIHNEEKETGLESAKPVDAQEKTVDAKDETLLAKQVRAIMNPTKFGSEKGLVESVDEDGGYTVPEDISTKIEHYNDVDYNLENDIDVVNVTTNKGARTFQKKGEVDTFVDIDENGAIANEIDAPKFERLPYAIQDRAGFMPVSNDLIADSDANIMGIVTEWLGKAYVATTNAKVLAKVAEKAQVDLKDLDGIKHALNVTLGQAYKHGAKIYTNDDGLNYLDTLKDENGRYLLNPDPTAPANMQLRIGNMVVGVKVLPNKVFPSTEGKVPFIVGNLADYVRKYRRQGLTLKASDVATLGSFNAFAQNMTLIRAIMRDDYRVKDADSIVNGYITVVGE
jgi:HK97 family phage major capsid protein